MTGPEPPKMASATVQTPSRNARPRRRLWNGHLSVAQTRSSTPMSRLGRIPSMGSSGATPWQPMPIQFLALYMSEMWGRLRCCKPSSLTGPPRPRPCPGYATALSWCFHGRQFGATAQARTRLRGVATLTKCCPNRPRSPRWCRTRRLLMRPCTGSWVPWLLPKVPVPDAWSS